MESIEVKQGSVVLARIIKAQVFPEGLSFVSSDNEYIQLGTWKYNKGKKLLAHKHNEYERTALLTQEVIIVKKGKVNARIYGTDDKLVKQIELKQGDCAIMLQGAHGFDILEDDAEVIEVKNGPYGGPEKDRTRLES